MRKRYLSFVAKDYASDIQNYINANKIKQKDIQAIILDGSNFYLYYWENE